MRVNFQVGRDTHEFMFLPPFYASFMSRCEHAWTTPFRRAWTPCFSGAGGFRVNPTFTRQSSSMQTTVSLHQERAMGSRLSRHCASGLPTPSTVRRCCALGASYGVSETLDDSQISFASPLPPPPEPLPPEPLPPEPPPPEPPPPGPVICVQVYGPVRRAAKVQVGNKFNNKTQPSRGSHIRSTDIPLA